MRFLRVYNRHNVRFVWVKGHAETVENNRCDCLAVAAANDKAHWLEDTGYDPAERYTGRPPHRNFGPKNTKIHRIIEHLSHIGILFLSLRR